MPTHSLCLQREMFEDFLEGVPILATLSKEEKLTVADALQSVRSRPGVPVRVLMLALRCWGFEVAAPTVTMACAQRTGAAARESLWRDHPAGLSAVHARGSATAFRAA